eukprot:scaffold5290_cov63-Phaeocystis_antarctica.AAC.2
MREKEVPLVLALQRELGRRLGVDQTNCRHSRRDVCSLQGEYAHEDERRKDDRHETHRDEVRSHLENRPERRGHHIVHGLRQNGHLEEDTEEEDSGQAEVARESEIVCRRTTWGLKRSGR